MDSNSSVDESLFYCDLISNEATESFINPLKQYSARNSQQVYILKKALGTKKEYNYSIKDVAIILIPKHPIIILDYGEFDEKKLEDYQLDFIEDLGHLSDKYEYNKILGRARKWNLSLFKIYSSCNFDVQKYVNEIVEEENIRKIDLFISLLIGSINSIDKIGLQEPTNLLDKVKQKVILFDGKQSGFIYQTANKDSITIQGMAGTGKTELLLHKLKDIYATDKDSVIAFTCFNRVLATDMKKRIPKFFNFMRVDEQIDWENRLHVFHSWGSSYESNSGMYRYICGKYKLLFRSYGFRDFDDLCKSAYEQLEKMDGFQPCFDYIFIDESQDFKEGFFNLCKKVTKKTVYIAGDIFQNIYDTTANNDISPEYLLNKCYRTDPRTLMFAHAVGMGLYEEPHLNWLNDSGWESCGYSGEWTENKKLILSRSPLRRFEDLGASNTIRLLSCPTKNYSSKILECIDNIKAENPSVCADDLAIIILGNYNKMCKIADDVTFELYDRYKWKSVKGYETKEKISGNVYISNVNNIKGLEFPFVVCLAIDAISNNLRFRNSIYMALTRSFLTSYFIVNEANSQFLSSYNQAIKEINDTGKMILEEPTDKEKEDMKSKITILLTNQKKSLVSIIDDLIDTSYHDLDENNREIVIETFQKIPEGLSEGEVKERAISFIENVLRVHSK